MSWLFFQNDLHYFLKKIFRMPNAPKYSHIKPQQNRSITFGDIAKIEK